MSATDLLLAAAVLAALACPAHMLWRLRRGERAACCPPVERARPISLAERQRRLARRVEAIGARRGGEG